MSDPVLEPAAQAFVEATADPPYLFELEPEVGRKTVDEAQTPEIDVPGTVTETVAVEGGPTGSVQATIFRPSDAEAPLPVVLYIHGAGWVFGNDHTHGRLARELAKGVGAAVVFPNYSLSPEARFPVATEQNYAVAQWIMQHGSDHGLDATRTAVVGDSVGGNMAASLALTAKERGDVDLAGQVLFYPVTDANFDTGSYEQFATGFFLRRDGMQWFWDQYTTDPDERALPTASPLRASADQLRDLPRTLVITAEADVLRDEGEAFANKLRTAGVSVTCVRYQGIIHDFVMLNALRDTNAANAAISQAIWFLSDTLAADR